MAYFEQHLFDAPCVFCGYKGSGYFKVGTHDKNCPWYFIGGIDDRISSLSQVISTLYKKSICKNEKTAIEEIEPLQFEPQEYVLDRLIEKINEVIFAFNESNEHRNTLKQTGA